MAVVTTRQQVEKQSCESGRRSRQPTRDAGSRRGVFLGRSATTIMVLALCVIMMLAVIRPTVPTRDDRVVVSTPDSDRSLGVSQAMSPINDAQQSTESRVDTGVPETGPITGTEWANSSAPTHSTASPKNVTLGAVPIGGVAPATSSTHWWFTNFVSSSFSEDAQAMFYNITTPDSFSQDDTIFIGLSAWDTFYYLTDLGIYDQMGIVAGSWYVSQTSNPCSSTSDWCAYFSTCIGSSTNGYCTTSAGVWETWEWALQPSTSYEEEFSISDIWDSSIGMWWATYQGFLFSGSGQLLDSWSQVHLSNNEVFLMIKTQQTYGSSTSLDFTDYEEVYNIGNSVDPWPAFNLHTLVGVFSVQHGSTPHVPWGGYEWAGSGYPTDQPGTFVQSFYGSSNHQNYVNISNMPFAVWVGNPFGSGLYSVTITLPYASPFQASANIDPLADPGGGSDVYYQANYCSLNCQDYVYIPSYSIIQPYSDLHSPNAVMWIDGYVPSAGTYTMSMYAYSPTYGSTYLSYWTITFTR